MNKQLCVTGLVLAHVLQFSDFVDYNMVYCIIIYWRRGSRFSAVPSQ